MIEDMLNKLGIWAEPLGVLIASVGVIVTSVSVLIVLIQLNRDKDAASKEAIRRKKEATLEMYKQWYDEIHKKDAFIRESYGIKVKSGNKSFLSVTDVKEICSDEDVSTRELLLDVLRGLERIGLAVEEDVYDYDFLFELSRIQFISFYGVYLNYIQHAKRTQPTVYSHFSSLVERLIQDSKDRNLTLSKAYVAALESSRAD